MGHSARTIKDLLRLLPAVVRFLAGHFQDPRPRVEGDQYQVHDELCRGRLIEPKINDAVGASGGATQKS